MIRNRILYVLVFVLSLLFIYFFDDKIVFITLYTVLLLPLASFLMAFLSVWGLAITQQVDKDFIVKDEEALYNLSIRNKSILTYPGVRFNFAEDKFAVASEAKSFMLSINPRAVETVSYPIYCRYRGIYEIGLQEIEIQDFLGLFRLRRRIKEKVLVTVYPKVVEITNFPLSMNLMSKAQSNYSIKEEDYATVSDVRKYAPEDSYKRIHWKLSAKKNELMVKNFQSTARNATVVILDSVRYIHSEHKCIILEDRIIEGLVSILHYCLKRQFPVDLLYGDGLQQAVDDIGDFESLYIIAAEFSFNGQQPVAKTIEKYLDDQVNFTNIIILTSRLDALLFEKLASAFYFGHFITLIYFTSDSSTAGNDFLSQLRQIGIVCYNIGSADSISHILGA